ncbi:hypothetical protein [Coleofasciculus sp. FACHB-129]|uniref:hypothetical protein n=1 Tax=Cyanophyceae TaxID=3028117 RepID=UPI0016832ADE|nr:hypothetical protein [Coleofasciculus sp. FACHB-129]MBD1896901.1 hypothetical protein [Coleofasciculus sp. FACHB-129]
MSNLVRPLRKILLLEINEVPWQLIDKFKTDPRFPHIRKFFDNAKTYTTLAVDSGELSPWVTWPSFYRGMSNQEHGIKNLGQNPGTFKGKPLWEEFRELGLSIGICGSLQSWPPSDPGEGGFYIPDTFAHDERCIPRYIESFQKFNLGQVAKNGLVVKKDRLISKDLSGLLASLPKLGISRSTIIQIAKQLCMEWIDPPRVARRSTFQTILLWDIFKSLYNAHNPPAFSTFFTNHVASVMHRYWHHIFPEEFGDRYLTQPKIHAATMIFALEILDKILADAMQLCKVNPEITLVFATSMGQAAIHRDEYQGFSSAISDIPKFMGVFGLQKTDYKQLLAMVPQIAVEIPDPQVRYHLIQKLNNCYSMSGKPLFEVEEITSSLSITIRTPPAIDIKLNKFIYKNKNGESIDFSWESAGITMHQVEAGTAYHIPEGIMAVFGCGIVPQDSRQGIKASSCKSLLLKLAFETTDVKSAYTLL